VPGVSDLSESILVDRSDGLVTVTFNRPERKNAIAPDQWQLLDQIVTDVWRSPEDRALILTGAGGNFSSGADLSHAGGTGADESGERPPPQSTLYEMRRVNEITLRIHRMPKPTLAAVDGVAVGVALGLALACDLVLASDRARFGAIFAKRGLTVDGGTSWTLPRLVGARRAKQMAFFGDMVPADQALEWGLINDVVGAEELPDRAAEWGRRLASGPTTALSLTKRMLDASSTLTFEQALEEEARSAHIAYTTKDLIEGMTAFMERRDPKFIGR
jgi:2-(1,2-epoxy-1,2-dihydrophenyl)acetyl-CoA isomerase